MTGSEFYEERMLSDIAKGRYKKESVRAMIEECCMRAVRNSAERIFEFCFYISLQELHYNAGYDKDALDEYFAGCVDAVEAFYAGAYDLDDMKTALEQDAGFSGRFAWRK